MQDLWSMLFCHHGNSVLVDFNHHRKPVEYASLCYASLRFWVGSYSYLLVTCPTTCCGYIVYIQVLLLYLLYCWYRRTVTPTYCNCNTGKTITSVLNLKHRRTLSGTLELRHTGVKIEYSQGENNTSIK